jgi:hypothetical protein
MLNTLNGNLYQNQNKSHEASVDLKLGLYSSYILLSCIKKHTKSLKISLGWIKLNE